MAKLHITVYSMMARDAVNGALPAPMTPPLAELQVEIVGFQSKQSDQFPDGAHFVMVKPEVACALAFGENPKAKPDTHPLDAGEIRWYGVTPGHRIAVIERLV